MRRGRIFIILAFLVIIGVIVVVYYFVKIRPPSKPTPPSAQATQQTQFVEIVTAKQNIAAGTTITEDMLGSLPYPADKVVVGLYTNKNDLLKMYAVYPIPQGMPIMSSMVSKTPGGTNLPGSYWAKFIPQGLTAVAIPMTRLSSVAYGIRDGDHVNLVVTMMIVDIDPTTQSSLPNKLGSVEETGTGGLKITSSDVIQGHLEQDPLLTSLLVYIQPSETQRPRIVTQMILQDVQVLHVGNFPVVGETGNDQLLSAAAGTAGATPTPAPSGQTVPTVVHPDIITLMVAPQDAVMLTYLMFNNVQITMTLRNPNDQEPASQTEAASLEYLLTQYNIPVPAKLPYSLEPRVNQLKQPQLVNDTPTTPHP